MPAAERAPDSSSKRCELTHYFQRDPKQTLRTPLKRSLLLDLPVELTREVGKALLADPSVAHSAHSRLPQTGPSRSQVRGVRFGSTATAFPPSKAVQSAVLPNLRCDPRYHGCWSR